jgi:hypothetical protein
LQARYWRILPENGAQQKQQKIPQPPEQQSDIMASGGEDGVDGITVGSGEMISFQKAIAFSVADHRFDGVPPLELPFDSGRSLGAGVRNVNLGLRQAVPR